MLQQACRKNIQCPPNGSHRRVINAGRLPDAAPKQHRGWLTSKGLTIVHYISCVSMWTTAGRWVSRTGPGAPAPANGSDSTCSCSGRGMASSLSTGLRNYSMQHAHQTMRSGRRVARSGAETRCFASAAPSRAPAQFPPETAPARRGHELLSTYFKAMQRQGRSSVRLAAMGRPSNPNRRAGGAKSVIVDHEAAEEDALEQVSSDLHKEAFHRGTCSQSYPACFRAVTMSTASSTNLLLRAQGSCWLCKHWLWVPARKTLRWRREACANGAFKLTFAAAKPYNLLVHCCSPVPFSTRFPPVVGRSSRTCASWCAWKPRTQCPVSRLPGTENSKFKAPAAASSWIPSAGCC